MTSPAHLAEPLPVDRRGEVDTVVLVIGTGFGGSVAAARLAEIWGPRVLVVERGREARPGDFPATFGEVTAEIRGPANPLGLFDVRIGRDVNVVAANGLGGGSLLYAGVTLPAADDVFDTCDPQTGRRIWPAAVHGDALREHYRRVRSMLAVEAWLDESDVERGGPATPPNLLDGSPVAADIVDPARSRARDKYGRVPRDRPRSAKAEPVREFAKRMGAPAYRTPLAINMTRVPDGQPNEHGVVRNLCTHCGDCVTGCNFGAKNSLTTNYLPYARARGAHICVGVEVLRVRPGNSRRWTVDAVHRDVKRGRPRARRIRLHADIVVVAAGAAGSTELMLRSHGRSLPLSPALGTRMSGNGDAMALSFDGDRDLWAAASDEHPAPGPTITLAADIVTADGRSLIQDGAFPSPILPRIGRMLAAIHRRWPAVWHARRAAAALDRSQVWLAMGTDSAAGRAELDHRGRLRIDWPGANSEPAQRRREEWLAELSTLQSAEPLLVGPETAASRAVVTVHLLGGCPMSDDPERGVVDAAGRVYDPRGGFHSGLFVLDGSVCPTALGVNPSLSIASVTENAFALAGTEVTR